MARKQRIHYDGALYHVIARGNNREYIFKHDEDKEAYQEKLFQYSRQYGAKLYAYVVMDNHCHMLMEVGEVPVSKIMQLVQQTFTGWYNRKYGHSGHVFEQRFKSILCDRDAYLLALVRYIHQNPVRAGIGSLDYLYSSHGLYMRYDVKVCQTQEVLGQFAQSKKKAVALYFEFVSKAENLIGAVAEGDLAPEQSEIAFELSKISGVKIDKGEVIAAYEVRTGADIDDLKKKYLTGDALKHRNRLIHELVKSGAMTQVEVSREFGLSQSYVSRISK